jgi:hypothetical protein
MRYLIGFILGGTRATGKEEYQKYFSRAHPGVLTNRMRAIPDRTVFTVLRDGDDWVVEHGGENFGHSHDKEVAKAFAHKRAREVIDRGGGAEVRVRGEALRP